MTVPIYSSFAAISPLPTPYAACTASDAHFGHASAHLFMAYSVATSSPDIGHPAVVSSRANAAAVMATAVAAVDGNDVDAAHEWLRQRAQNDAFISSSSNIN